MSVNVEDFNQEIKCGYKEEHYSAGTKSSLFVKQLKNTIAGSGLMTGTYYPHVSDVLY